MKHRLIVFLMCIVILPLSLISAQEPPADDWQFVIRSGMTIHWLNADGIDRSLPIPGYVNDEPIGNMLISHDSRWLVHQYENGPIRVADLESDECCHEILVDTFDLQFDPNRFNEDDTERMSPQVIVAKVMHDTDDKLLLLAVGDCSGAEFCPTPPQVYAMVDLSTWEAEIIDEIGCCFDVISWTDTGIEIAGTFGCQPGAFCLMDSQFHSTRMIDLEGNRLDAARPIVVGSFGGDLGKHLANGEYIAPHDYFAYCGAQDYGNYRMILHYNAPDLDTSSLPSVEAARIFYNQHMQSLRDYHTYDFAHDGQYVVVQSFAIPDVPNQLTLISRQGDVWEFPLSLNSLQAILAGTPDGWLMISETGEADPETRFPIMILEHYRFVDGQLEITSLAEVVGGVDILRQPVLGQSLLDVEPFTLIEPIPACGLG